jgi:hypothetical protein
MNKRIKVLGLIGLTIVMGLLSRKLSFLPLWIGDMFWAIMIYFGVKFIFIERKVKLIVFSSLAICYLVEISQLYQADWINSIRSTTLGHLALGQGFLWSDLIAYTFGILIVILLETVVHKLWS